MLVLYTQPRCHYCEIMKRMLSKMDEAEGFQTVDITKDPEARSFLKKKGHKTVPMLYLKVPDHEIWINKDIDTRKLTGENLGKRITDAIAQTKKDNCLVFDVDGTCVFLQDDGQGNVMTITDEVTNPQIINPSAGTVDYKTGEVKLTNFKVETFTGSAIKISAKTKAADIKAPKGRVFILRDTDVKVIMNLVEFNRPIATQSATNPPTGTTTSY